MYRVSDRPMPGWWNWYTRTLEVRMLRLRGSSPLSGTNLVTYELFTNIY